MSNIASGKSPGDIAMGFHSRFHVLKQELHQAASELKEPKGQALMETAAEVLDGLEHAFDHFSRKAEHSWK